MSKCKKRRTFGSRKQILDFLNKPLDLLAGFVEFSFVVMQILAEVGAIREAIRELERLQTNTHVILESTSSSSSWAWCLRLFSLLLLSSPSSSSWLGALGSASATQYRRKVSETPRSDSFKRDRARRKFFHNQLQSTPRNRVSSTCSHYNSTRVCSQVSSKLLSTKLQSISDNVKL